MLGEEHNVVEIPELTAALLHDLQGTAGYHYLALEQDPATMNVASRGPMHGHLDSLAAFARRYPHAFTFVSDQELAMIASAGAESHGGGDPVWGLETRHYMPASKAEDFARLDSAFSPARGSDSSRPRCAVTSATSSGASCSGSTPRCTSAGCDQLRTN